MKQIKDLNWVPPGGWTYRHPETGVDISSGSLDNVVNKVRAYNEVNHFPNGVNLEQQVIDGVCERCPECCTDTEPPSPLDIARRFAREMTYWMANGCEVTESEVFHTRKSTCEACPKWRGEAAFGLGRCGSCGCLGLKLYVATSRCPDGKW